MVARCVSCPVLFALTCLTLAGCGSTGPYDMSGTVTYKDQPVPRGYITFVPDGSKDNKGPGGLATIVNGEYRTEKGKGIVGGPYRIRIVGMDGKATKISGEEILDGKPLFDPHETTLDLPKANHQHNFVIPDKQ